MQNSQPTAVPMKLDGSQAGGGGWNEICFRLYSEYNINNQLVIDIEKGVVLINVENVKFFCLFVD